MHESLMRGFPSPGSLPFMPGLPLPFPTLPGALPHMLSLPNPSLLQQPPVRPPLSPQETTTSPKMEEEGSGYVQQLQSKSKTSLKDATCSPALHFQKLKF